MDYIVLGALLMETGAEIPDHIKFRIIESINFEMKNESRLRTTNVLKSREIFYTDYKDKILNYKSGQNKFLINLKLRNDEELEQSFFGLDKLYIALTQKKIDNIKYINLDGSNLIDVPSEIEKFQQAQMLSLEHNKLETIPESIFELKNLEILLLNGNSLHSISETILQLSNLKVLNLAYNNLTNLPEAMGSLISLKHLYLLNNNLKSIPQSLGNLENLSLINLENDPLENLSNNLIPDPYSVGLFRSKAQYEKIMKERKK